MAVSLSDLKRKKRELVLEVGEDDLNIVYDPSSITPASQDAFFQLIEKYRYGRALASILADRLVSWDLMDEEGNVIPITEEALSEVPVDVLEFIHESIIDDLKVDKDDLKNSGGGLRQNRAKRPRSRRGTTDMSG